MTEILDEAAVSEIEARSDAATKGDWTIRGASWIDGGVHLAGYGVRFADTPMDVTYGGWDARTNFPPDTEQGRQASNDRAFIAHARADIPALISTVKALREQTEKLRETDAQIAESFRHGWNSDNTFRQVAETIAAAIRARKEG